MKSEDCKDCKYLMDMTALSIGFRCSKPEHQEYNDDVKKVPTLIELIPDGCNYKEVENEIK